VTCDPVRAQQYYHEVLCNYPLPNLPPGYSPSPLLNLPPGIWAYASSSLPSGSWICSSCTLGDLNSVSGDRSWDPVEHLRREKKMTNAMTVNTATPPTTPPTMPAIGISTELDGEAGVVDPTLMEVEEVKLPEAVVFQSQQRPVVSHR
jgi:hypothetical protein